MGEVTDFRMAGEDHAVLTVEGSSAGYRRSPCGGCPWVVDNTGDFPAEAFEHSANTAYDAAFETFACHEAGKDRSLICAGFLLRNADNNLGVRLAASAGKVDISKVHPDDRQLHDSYRDMAVANGVDPDNPVLTRCRGNNDL